MRSRALFGVALLGTLAAGGSVQAQSTGFDDLGGSGNAIANGYLGLQWSNFYELNGLTYGASGYQNGVVSNPNVAYNGYGSSASFYSANPFDFASAYFTAAWVNGLTIDVTGYNNGNQTYFMSFVVNSNAPTLENFNWTNVDQVTFNSYGGTDAGYGGCCSHFAMDDLTLSAAPSTVTPEPVSMTLIGTGLAGIAAARRRRRQSSAVA